MADDLASRWAGRRKEFKSLSDINQSFKVLGSKQLVNHSFQNDNSVEALTASSVLGSEIDAQKSKIETLRAALENASIPSVRQTAEHKTGRYNS